MRIVEVVEIYMPVPPRNFGPGDTATTFASETSHEINTEAVVSFDNESTVPLSAFHEYGKPSVFSGSSPTVQMNLMDMESTYSRHRTLTVKGSKEEMRRLLQDGPKNLGVSVTLTSGNTMTVAGTILGTLTLKKGETLYLDPSYLDRSVGQWTMSRPTGMNPRYSITLSPNRAFQVEKKSAPSEPGGTPTWSQLAASVSPQAACTIRPEQ